MKQILFPLVVIFITSICMAQGNFQVNNQQGAHYPGGDAALQEYLNNNINFTPEAINKRVYGSVSVSFAVLADSTIEDVSIMSGLGYGIDEEIERLLYSLKFAPAMSNNVMFRSTVFTNFIISAYKGPEMEIEK